MLDNGSTQEIKLGPILQKDFFKRNCISRKVTIIGWETCKSKRGQKF